MDFKEELSYTSQTLALTGEKCQKIVDEIVEVIFNAFKNEKKLLLCGNGGSAADAQHFAGELTSSFNPNLIRPSFPAIALTTNTSVITAYANDFSFNSIFARQIEGLGKPGDVIVVLTTSGSSKNCIEAAVKSREMNLISVAFTSSNAEISSFVDYAIEIPSKNTQQIQTAHLVVYHYICRKIEEKWIKHESYE